MTENQDFSYGDILRDCKNKIQIAGQQAAISVNSQLLSIYWEIGKTVLKQQQQNYSNLPQNWPYVKFCNRPLHN